MVWGWKASSTPEQPTPSAAARATSAGFFQAVAGKRPPILKDEMNPQRVSVFRGLGSRV